MAVRTIEVSPRRMLAILGAGILFLFIAHACALTSTYVFGQGHLFGLVPLFHLNNEQSVPTLYSTILLAACAAMLFVIGYLEMPGTRRALPWLCLGALFLFLSLDEFASVHERLNAPVRNTLDTSGLLYFAWIIPYAGGVSVLALIYFPWFSRLMAGIRVLFALSAGLYFGGVFVLEALGGWYHSTFGFDRGLTYDLIVTVEELLELSGVSLFIYSLLVYIQRVHGGVAILIPEDSPKCQPRIRQ